MTTSTNPTPTLPPATPCDPSDEIDAVDLLLPVLLRWKLIATLSLLAGVAAIAITFMLKPVFTARTSFLPPQQQQSSAIGALASLGGLAGLATSAAGIRSPIDQYVALLQSNTVRDRLIDQFKLQVVYGEPLRTDARAVLGRNIRVSAGKRDGIITVEVDDTDPLRAATMANQNVTELRTLVGQLALTEAQQRRRFFEQQLNQVSEKLDAAQRALQDSGFSARVLRAEPKASAESYAKLKAELTAAEVRLSAARSQLTDKAPEIQQLAGSVAALRSQLARTEASTPGASDGDGDLGYISKYREFKYQETLFELFSRQFEVARLDEAREGSAVQVIDEATPPERKSRPKRSVIGILSTVGVALALSVWFMVRDRWRQGTSNPGSLRSRLHAARVVQR